MLRLIMTDRISDTDNPIWFQRVIWTFTLFIMYLSVYFPGQMHAYIRDCSNGKNFSTPDFPQFAYLEPKLNHSICVYRTKILYCITLCNTGDFCNGPQIDSGCIHSPAHMWIILSIVLTLFITRAWCGRMIVIFTTTCVISACHY
jgi:hypothetical protein